jgi:glutaredoxin
MKRVLLFALLLPLLADAGTIYSTSGPNGSRVYSDEPIPNARHQKTIEFADAPATQMPESVQKFRQDLEARIQARKSEPPPSERPLLFSASWCGYCKMAKNWLGQRGISYREFDIDTEAGMSALIQTGGGKSVPLLVWKGQKLRGFSAGSYEQFFGKKDK